MKIKVTNRPPQITFEVNNDFQKNLSEVLEVIKNDAPPFVRVTQSQFIREAVLEKIDRTKQSHPAFQSLNSAEMPNQ